MLISRPKSGLAAMVGALAISAGVMTAQTAQADALTWDDVRIVIDVGGRDDEDDRGEWRDLREERQNWKSRQLRKLEAKYERFESRAWRDGVLTRQEYRKLRRLEDRLVEVARNHHYEVEYRY